MRSGLFYIAAFLWGLFLLPENLEAQNNHPVGSPALNYFFDNFENAPAFVNAIPSWTTIDEDESPTWGIEGTKFPLQYTPMSFIVFCPDSTVPALTDTAFRAYSGNKFAACFAATVPPNSDWLISPKVHAEQQSHCSFYIRSFAAQFGLERYRVGVSTTDPSPSSFTFLTGENYLTAPAGVWTKKKFDLSNYDGQDIYIGIQCVSDNSFILMVDDFEFRTAMPQIGTITGLVTDAVSGLPVAGAMVSARGITTYTDSNGNYTLEQVPVNEIMADFESNINFGAAPLTVQFTDKSDFNLIQVVCAAENYINYVNEQVNVIPGGNLQLNISLSPLLLEGEMRFVLNWSDKPFDLDSHLNTPTIGGETHHIYYNNPGSSTAIPYAALDYDVTQGFGPETMTIYRLESGTYQYYIQNFSQTPPLTESQAVLQIYNQHGLAKTVYVPETGAGNFWYVCDVEGSTGDITIINRIQSTAPGGRNGDSGRSVKVTPVPESREWLWSFGDGAISTLPNPTHTYMSKGKYTVTLQVNDGIRQATETKINYIDVGSVGLEPSVESNITIAPVPAHEQVSINSPVEILSYELISPAGTVLMSSTPQSQFVQIDIHHLSSGVYLLKLQTNSGSVIKKIVKQ
ncbi:MAG: choice-of-anchor J domain-containing protein [Lentimicrobiaceae bacterium]|nr:choice-of-anchor J domain-containing protein [Lentimicrobiaceae bacterium]